MNFKTALFLVAIIIGAATASKLRKTKEVDLLNKEGIERCESITYNQATYTVTARCQASRKMGIIQYGNSSLDVRKCNKFGIGGKILGWLPHRCNLSKNWIYYCKAGNSPDPNKVSRYLKDFVGAGFENGNLFCK